MAPHDTNTPKEARRHLVPLVGIAAAVVIVIIAFVWWIGHATSGAEKSEPGAPVEQTEPAPATNP
jgi:hypothetical protein